MTEDILAALNPEIVQRLKTAVELGKWPDGRRLTDAQRETCLHAVLVWEAKHLPEQERTGYIHKPEKKDCDHPHEAQEQQVKFLH